MDFEHDDSVLFFSCYKHLATKADTELRKLCASQLPAVLRAATALAAAAFSQQFQDTLNNLATDHDVEVGRRRGGMWGGGVGRAARRCMVLRVPSVARVDRLGGL